jgi:hypothetical protein
MDSFVNLWEYATTEIYSQIKEDLPKESLEVSAYSLKLSISFAYQRVIYIEPIRMGYVLAAE